MDRTAVFRELCGELWGERIQVRRTQIGLSQEQLGVVCGVTQQTISKIERGAVVPRDSLKLILAMALGTSLDHLFAWPPVRDIERATEGAAA